VALSAGGAQALSLWQHRIAATGIGRAVLAAALPPGGRPVRAASGAPAEYEGFDDGGTMVARVEDMLPLDAGGEGHEDGARALGEFVALLRAGARPSGHPPAQPAGGGKPERGAGPSPLLGGQPGSDVDIDILLEGL
jgi:hypothetical protein